ncbi:hypothetical protein B0H12DRAFT_680349 [Mycena haematopus]|nr:hypothetical protein B0H12DRAFT_680349 [Mycena haematopus]
MRKIFSRNNLKATPSAASRPASRAPSPTPEALANATTRKLKPSLSSSRPASPPPARLSEAQVIAKDAMLKKAPSKAHLQKANESTRPMSPGRPRSLSSSGSAPHEWPPRSPSSTPWTTPANSWPSSGIPPRDQVLRSAALVSKILEHIECGPDRRSLKAQRQSLLWIALTCKAVSLTAIKFLWRRLDNVLPLLHLLPTFNEKNGKYGLFGASHPHEWHTFDHHATYVKEVIYEDIPGTIQIDPAVYLRLFLRNPSVLPNLERFSCRTSVRPSESEILVYLQSPIHVLELGTFEAGTLHSGDTSRMAATREAVVSHLSTHPSNITRLLLVDQPFSLFSELGGHGHGGGALTPLQNLTSLEFRAMYGVMDATILRQIGSLPHLRSFTADSGCFTGLNLSNIASRLTRPAPPAFGSGPNQAPPPPPESNGGGGLFTHLTHLALERHPSMPHATISSFLQLVASPRLRSIVLSVRPARKAPSPRGGAHAGVSPSHNDLQTDPLYIIAQRWTRSLLFLELEVDHNHATLTNFLRHVPGLRRLTLSGFLHVPDDVDLISAFTALSLLECLTLRLKTGVVSGEAPTPYAPLVLDMHALTRLVRVCPRIRELETAIEPPAASPPSSTWPVSQNLRKLLVHGDTAAAAATAAGPSSTTLVGAGDTSPVGSGGRHGARSPSVWSASVWSSGSGDGSSMSPNAVLALARYLDRLFPRLNTVRYVCGSGGGGGGEKKGERLSAESDPEAPTQAAWSQVQDLIFAFQDVRMGA